MAGRILILEELATNRIALSATLSSASHIVERCDGAEKLLQQARSCQPDVIMLDAGLSSANPFSLCRDLTDNPETRAIPVVLIADAPDPELRVRALRAGAVQVFARSLAAPSLLARLRKLLRLRSADRELAARQATASELGFAEERAGFAARPVVWITEDLAAANPGWVEAIRSAIGPEIRVSSAPGLLEGGSAYGAPDLVILPVGGGNHADSLELVAELRSREDTGATAILAVDDNSAGGTGRAALDIGANDLLAADSLPEELVLRMQQQLDRKRMADLLRATVESSMRLAATDPLTGLFNRRYAATHMRRIAKRACDDGTPFAVMVLDLDHFKKINDTHGHAAGDAVLQAVARRLKSNLRGVDLLCRMGGEEFLVIMPETDLGAARAAAERLRRVIEAAPIELPGDAGSVTATVSIGVSIGGLDDNRRTPVEQLVDSADRALLGAKSSGRNQVSLVRPAA